MIFYTGLHHPAKARYLGPVFISINSVIGRIRPVPSDNWIMDSGAFQELERFGAYRSTVKSYAYECNILAERNPGLRAVVSQDYMCEDFILEKTGMTVNDHQRLTVERYRQLREYVQGVYLMPVLQGYAVESYVDHIAMYGDLLQHNAYVGVGSVCKRNKDIGKVEAVLRTIKRARPDLKLHGFGIKTTALSSGIVREALYSADSMAWSFAARKEGRGGNDWRDAARFAKRIETMSFQYAWDF